MTEIKNDEQPTRTIVRVGNSVGIVLDKFMLHDAGLTTGDKLEYKCTKNKIVLKKKKEETKKQGE